MNYKVTIQKGEDRGFVASVPLLPGCHSQGKSVEEALFNIKEAIGAYLAVSQKHGDPIPREDQELIEAVVTFPRQDNKGSFAFA